MWIKIEVIGENEQRECYPTKQRSMTWHELLQLLKDDIWYPQQKSVPNFPMFLNTSFDPDDRFCLVSEMDNFGIRYIVLEKNILIAQHASKKKSLQSVVYK